MAAEDNLNHLQFSVTPHDPSWRESHFVRAKVGDYNEVGYLQWNSRDGHIERVSVAPQLRRKGIATAMLAHANQAAQEHGLVSPLHDPNDQTKSGKKWAKAVGGPSVKKERRFFNGRRK